MSSERGDCYSSVFTIEDGSGDPFTDPKQLYAASRGQMNTHPDTARSVESDPYVQIESGNFQSASTADLISQDSSSSQTVFPRPITLDIQHQPQKRIMGRYDSRKRNKDSVSTDISETGSDKQFISKCSFYIVVALALVAMVLAAGSSIVMLRLMSKCDELERKLNSAQTSYTLAQQEVHTCLPCGELSQGPFEEDNEDLKGLISKDENGVRVCCAKTASQLSIMLNLFAKRKRLEACSQESLLKENLTASCNNTSTPGSPPARINGTISAHLVVGNSQTGREEDYQPIRNWRQGLPGTHLSNINITAENSRIVVPETGLYFLYSQVGFLVYYDKEQTEQSASQSLFHVVYRYNAIYPIDGSEELLRSVVTQCWEKQKDYGRYTSYVGAAVKLNKGDQLYVKVSRIQDVNKGASTTYFGLFKL
ncbi:uncharacterized protein LOC123555198 isoform X2 [Mercenaria mercenaria]|uniref:uncharacterized protein LOC123555198 isoform X2 n=1 Tax=Mercenaria mercenaria TaxID=6596 RepID=UPI00234F58D7|nr:uncharacterized protein LOC123555198 isoform X2 [Mercenaria mercenaria]